MSLAAMLSGPAVVEATPATSVVFAVAVILLFGAVLLLIRALRGPTVFDRILAINAMGTKTVVLVALIAFIDFPHGNPSFFLDTALVYALVNFVATVAILKYIQYRRLG